MEDDDLERTTTTSWTGSYRDLAGLLGKFLWCHRVHDRRLSQIDDLMKLFRIAHPQEENENENWHAMTEVKGEAFNTLRKHYWICKENKRTPWPKEVPDLAKALLLATDASGIEESGTSGGLGAVMQLSTIATTNSPQSMSPISSFKLQHQDKDIAIAELRAVITAIKYAYAQYGKENIGLIILAIDSMAARGMIARGFSRNEEAIVLLKELDQLLAHRKIYMMYVRSAANPADEPSRDLEVSEEKWQALLPELTTMHEEAHEYFSNGKRAGIRREREEM